MSKVASPIVDAEAELDVLACYRETPADRAVIQRIISITDFWSKSRAKVYATMLSMESSDDIPSEAIVRRNPGDDGVREVVEQIPFGSMMKADVVARRVKSAALDREKQRISGELERVIATGDEPAQLRLLEDLQRIVAACSKLRSDDTNISSLSRFIPADELLSQRLHIDWLIHRLIECASTVQIFGASGGGKTFIALSIALAVATGRDWNGHKVKRGVVLYLAGEGRSGFPRRIRAFMQYHGLAVDELALFHVSRNTITMTGEGVSAAIAAGKEISDRLGAPVALIVVDTLARHIDGDECKPADMARYINAVDTLRDAFRGSTVISIHHPGLGSSDRGRGANNNYAALDTEIRIDAGIISFTKVKEGDQPDPIPFKLHPVQIGTDEEDGSPVTSCYVTFGERAERHIQASFTDTEKTAIKALIEVSVKHQQQHGDLIGALVGDWREAFYQARRDSDPDISQESLRKAWQRVQGGLTEKSAISESGHRRFLTSSHHQEEIRNTVGHGTKTGHVPECTGDSQTGHRDTHLIGVSRVPASVPPPDLLNLTADDLIEEATV